MNSPRHNRKLLKCCTSVHALHDNSMMARISGVDISEKTLRPSFFFLLWLPSPKQNLGANWAQTPALEAQNERWPGE